MNIEVVMSEVFKLQSTFVIIFIVILLSACNLPIASVSSDQIAGDDFADVLQPVDPAEFTVLTAYTNAEPASAEDFQNRLIQLYQRTNPAVVFIINSNGISGSGFVYSEEGYIITNNHVVSGTGSLEIKFSNGERLRASRVGTDVDSDLAVVKVEDLPKEVTPLPLSPPNSVQPGQFVVAIGNPFGEQGSMSFGIISGLGRSLPSQRNLGSTYSLPEVIQTDAPINPGNSGGPLLNLNGEVLGVATAIATETGSNTGVGFAIPVKAIYAIIPDLINTGEHDYGYMGAGFDSEVSLDEQTIYDISQTQGAYVLNVTSGSPADNAGLIPANPNIGDGGDLIIAIDGVQVNDFNDLNSYLVFYTSAGQLIELTVLRDGSEVTIPLTLGTRP
jgi:2-alkenal reductase